MQNPIRFLLFVAGMVGILMLFMQTIPKSPVAVAASPANGGTLTYCSTDGGFIIPLGDVGATSTIQVPDNAVIADLDVRLSASHQNVGDLEMILSNGTTTRTIFNRPRNGTGDCTGNNLENTLADDEATTSFSAACMDAKPGENDEAFAPNTAYRAGEPASGSLLAAYDNQNINGAWTLNVRDRSPLFVGIFEEWCLQFTVTGTPPLPTPTAPPVPTAPPLPTLTPVPPAPTSTPLPPGAFSLYQPLVIEGQLARCQTIENESTNPNNSAPQALGSLPLCFGVPFIGYHELEADREDIYLLEIEDNGDESTPLTVLLDVPDINLSLYLYDRNANFLAESAMPGLGDERIVYLAEPGRYFVRVYRTDAAVSTQPYQLTATLGE